MIIDDDPIANVREIANNKLATRQFKRAKVRNTIGGYALVIMLISVFCISISALLLIADYFWGTARGDSSIHAIIFGIAISAFIISGITTYQLLKSSN